MDLTPEREELEVDFVQVIIGLWKRKWLIAAVTAACCLLGLAWGLMYRGDDTKTDKYISSVTFYVGSADLEDQSGSPDSDEQSRAQYVTDMFKAVLGTPSALSRIAEASGLSLTGKEVAGMITIAENPEPIRLSRVIVRANDPETAVKIAQAAAEVMPGRMEEVDAGFAVKVVDAPTRPAAPDTSGRSRMSTSRRMLYLGDAGFVLSCLWTAALEIVNGRVYRERWLRRNYAAVPVLGVIPNLKKTGGSYDDLRGRRIRG